MEAEALKHLGRRWPSRIILYLGDYPHSSFSDIMRGLKLVHGHCPRQSTVWEFLADLRRAGFIKTFRTRRKPGTGASSYRHRYALSSLGEQGYRLLAERDPGVFPQGS